MSRPRRLLTVGHSYAVALNRRLADEMHRTPAMPGEPPWEVTVAAPLSVRGDLRPIALEAPLAGAAPTDGVSVYGLRSPHTLSYGRATRSLVRGTAWDFVHLWQEPYTWAGYQLGRWAGATPHAHYTFQNLAKSFPTPVAWLERAAVTWSRGWVACGVTVAETLSHRPPYDRKPHAVIPTGVDLAAFAPDPAARAAVFTRLGWSSVGPPVIGYLGRFVPEKGLSLLMSAADALRSNWRMLLVGGGPMEAQLRAWRARHGDRVRVVTGVPHAGVPAYVNAFDLLAAPSLSTTRWREQLGRMLLEAFAVGVPVVGSDSGEIPHVLADAGVVVPEGDVAAWAAALGDLLDSPARRRELGALGRERCAAVFAWPVVARQTLSFFNRLLAER